mmetsp:Transcript_72289/g.159661  ORF Transcript_72289/g.159661 Transcript_72289/m.159661 type:complete len:134 (+) Transcript_72289:617-1018(+)
MLCELSRRRERGNRPPSQVGQARPPETEERNNKGVVCSHQFCSRGNIAKGILWEEFLNFIAEVQPISHQTLQRHRQLRLPGELVCNCALVQVVKELPLHQSAILQLVPQLPAARFLLTISHRLWFMKLATSPR